MATSTQIKTELLQCLFVLLLLGAVAAADFVTGYEYTFFLFYLVPVLFVRRWAGQLAAFGMSFLCALIWLFVNVLEGQDFPDALAMLWETSIRLAVFLLIVALFTNREELQRLVRQRTAKLHAEVEERIRLEKELLEISEAEQRRIGQDLHDSLGQHLTAIALAGKVLAKKLTDKSLPEAEAADRLVNLTEEGIEITRKLARTLHPVELRSGGLADALQDLAANISKAFAVDCRFEKPSDEISLEKDPSAQMFRIAQEAVSNAIRHGKARQITLRLERSGEKILLSVTDNGAGLATDARIKNGLGLRIMDYRARLIGAKFDVENLPAGGARAVCVLNPVQFETEFYVAQK